MSSYLCISVTFLDPLFHGKGDDESEWPPSPLRLFQALLAGARSGCRGNQWSKAKAHAFRWLESSPPPLIVAPPTRVMSRCTFFVPNNDGDKEPDRQERLTSKVTRPHRLCEVDTVHYLWLLGQGDAAEEHLHAGVLSREARHLLALGWGIDQVVGEGRIVTDAEAAALQGVRWRPWGGQRHRAHAWRIPVAGSLDDLERVHTSFLERLKGGQYRPPLKLSRFTTVSYLSASTLPPRHYAVFELPEGVAFRQEDASKVAAMLRRVAGRCAQDDTHEFPGGSRTYVAGHTGQQAQTPPRFSYLPLPSVGHQHADGMIRRVVVAEPFGGDGAHAHWAQNRLVTQTLWDEAGNARGILLNLWRLTSRLMLERYGCAAEGKTWCTVTPVILPGFDDGKLAKAERLLLAAVRQADLPLDVVAEVTVRKAPFWPGSQHPHQYFLPNYLRHLPGWHVRLVFHEAVPGPLAVGGGRHAGLGVFARCDR